jgi:phage baseplate assembly protein gpV
MTAVGGDAITLIQAVVRDQLRAFKTTELAVVTAVHAHASAGDTNNDECDVTLRNSGLALKHVPVSTGRMGLVALPNVNDLVLVQFLHGDVHSAFITACLYTDATRPPPADAHECVYVSPDYPQSGVRRLYLELPNGNKLLLDDDKLVLEMGTTKLTVNHDGDVVVDSAAKLTITAGGDTAVDVTGNLSLSASGDVSVEGTNVSLTGRASTTLDGGPSTTVKGVAVKIAGKTDFSVA